MQLIEFYVKTERMEGVGDRMRGWAIPAQGSVLAYRGHPCRVRDVLHSPRSASGDQLPDPPTVFVTAPQEPD